jgi:hypothetical protein
MHVKNSAVFANLRIEVAQGMFTDKASDIITKLEFGVSFWLSNKVYNFKVYTSQSL